MLGRVASRDLRNHTADLLKRVDSGEEIVITKRGNPVATLIPYERPKRQWVSRTDVARLLEEVQADPGLRNDLDRLAGETTDDLEPLR